MAVTVILITALSTKVSVILFIMAAVVTTVAVLPARADRAPSWARSSLILILTRLSWSWCCCNSAIRYCCPLRSPELAALNNADLGLHQYQHGLSPAATGLMVVSSSKLKLHASYFDLVALVPILLALRSGCRVRR